MDFDLPAHLNEVRESVERFAATEIEPAIAEVERAGIFPRDIVRKMGEAGFFGAVFPESVGGSAMGFLAVAVIAEEISRLRPEFGYCMNLQAMTCPFTILNWGNPSQIERFVPDLIGGRRIGMFALSESGGGSDAAGSMKTRAERRGDRYILNGSKMWITFADACDAGVIFAKTDPAAGHRGVTAFIIEPKISKGYSAKPIPMKSLSNVLRSNAVFLDDVEIPVENRLGEEGEGFKIAMNALDYGRLTVSARLVGLAQACLDASIAYARARTVGGHALGRYQMIQHLIADMTVNVEAARLMTCRMACLMDRGEPATRAASRAKYLAAQAARHAALAVAEIHGGYALADEYRVQYLTAYINMLNVGEGAANVQRILIAEDALGYKNANRHRVRRHDAKAAE
ncbi:MAG: acyl-CoA dehydrogenase [Alphaproteobacteria bacterium]|nr:acyl-CoA dehydrogenase [Alphaproteobacteria bacterium]